MELKACIHQNVRRGVRAWIAFMFAALCLATALASCGAPPPAFAATGTGTLSIGGLIEYGTTLTRWMSFDDKTAYCVEPSKYTPAAMSYSWSTDVDASQPDPFYRYLYYGFGGPGFSRDDPAWPRTSWDGSPMTDDDYYLCTHLLLADAYASNGISTLFGLSAEARYWYAWNILGFGTNVGRDDDNPDATGWIFKSRGLPGTQAQLTGPDRPCRWDPDRREQVTGTFTFTSDNPNASFSFAIPAQSTVHNDTTGTMATAGTTSIRAGERFHFTAPPSVAGIWESGGRAVTGLRDFTPIRIASGSDSLQECASWKEGYEEVTREVAFKVTWLPFGDVEIVKTVESEAEVTPPLADIGFTLTNAETGEQVTITTDTDGRATTADLERDTFPHGRLTEGTWTIEETSGTPPGFHPLTPYPVTVSAATSPVRVVFENKRIMGAVRIAKVDAETKEHIALGGEDGASFEVQRRDDASGAYTPIEWQLTYPEMVRTTVLTTASDGTLSLPEPLPAGAYRLVEVVCPQGYASPDGTPPLIDFTVDEQSDWSSPLEIAVENQPIKGVIALTKSDRLTGKAVRDARYRIEAAAPIVTPDGTTRAAAGEAVGEMTTDEGGRAVSGELYPGPYLVYEITPPPGYALDKTAHPVEIATEGEGVPLVEVRIDVDDAPTTVQIAKASSLTSRPVPNATYRIWRADAACNGQTPSEGAVDGPAQVDAATDNLTQDDPTADTSTLDGAAALAGESASGGGLARNSALGDIVAKPPSPEDDSLETGAGPTNASESDLVAMTDARGLIELTHLEPGRYFVQEQQAPEGFRTDPTIWSFTVDDQGLVEGENGHRFHVEDVPIPAPLITTGDSAGTAVGFAIAAATAAGALAFASNAVRIRRLGRTCRRPLAHSPRRSRRATDIDLGAERAPCSRMLR